jgi:hypothetical protein
MHHSILILKNKISLLSVCVANLALGAALFAAGNEDPWPFRITPDAKPILNITLLTFPQNEFVSEISGHHELVFDGCRYVSRIVFPAISSYLISAGAGQFRWRRPDGADIELELDKKTPAGDHSWLLTKSGFDNYRITPADNSAESYDYSNCVLATLIIHGREYRFEYSDGRLVRIVRIDSDLNEELMTMEYNADGQISRLHAAGKNFVFEYGENLELLSCFEEFAHEKIMTFHYSGGLLTEAISREKNQNFVWGQPSFSEYWHPANPLSPGIIADGEFEYRTEVDRHGMTVYFHALSGKSRGQWDFDSRTQRVVWTYAK